MTKASHKHSPLFDAHLKSNPKVSKSVVEQYQMLEKELHRLGVDTRARYTLSHPFDRVAYRHRPKAK